MGNPIRVLIVEDSEDDARLMLRELRNGGYEPSYERVDTPEALMIALVGKTWDAALVDFSMPQFNGLDALMIVREQSPDLPFIIVTGAIGEELAAKLMREGAHDFVMKDKLFRLVPAIKRELHEARVCRESKRMAEKIILDRVEWERTFDMVDDLIMILDKDRRIVKANKAMAEKLGVSPKMAVGMTCYKYVHGTDEPLPNCPYTRLLEDGQAHSEEIFEERLGGHFLIRVSPFYDAEDNLTGAVHLASDITERKKAEELTTSHLRRLESLHAIEREPRPPPHDELDTGGSYNTARRGRHRHTPL